MFRFLKLLAILYRDFIVYNLIFTFLAGYTLLMYGRLGIPGAFWIKVIGFVVLAAGYYYQRRHRLFFYHNLGISRAGLIGYAICIDTLTAVAIFTIIYVFAGN